MKRTRARARRHAQPFAYGRIAELYDTSLRLFGFKRGVEQFLERVEWRLPLRPRVLDAGAGTGLNGLWFLRRFPGSEVVAFDIDRQMLAVLARRARRLGELRQRLIVAHGDLRVPDVLTRTDTGQALVLSPRSFDAVGASPATWTVRSGPCSSTYRWTCPWSVWPSCCARAASS